jgi:predicted transcriptional regulator
VVKELTKKEIMTTMSIRISQEEKEKLQKLAKEADLTLSQLVRKAIKENILAD